MVRCEHCKQSSGYCYGAALECTKCQKSNPLCKQCGKTVKGHLFYCKEELCAYCKERRCDWCHKIHTETWEVGDCAYCCWE